MDQERTGRGEPDPSQASPPAPPPFGVPSPSLTGPPPTAGHNLQGAPTTGGPPTMGVPVVPRTEVPLPAASPAKAGPTARGGAGAVATICLLAASLLLVPGLSLAWARSTIHDRAGWQDRLGDLNERPDVSKPLAQHLADVLSDDPSLEPAIAREARTVIERSSVTNQWRNTVGQVHDQAMGMASGERSGDATIDLGWVVDELESEGVELQPGAEDRADDVVVIEGRYADRIHGLSRLLDRGTIVLIVLGLALVAVGLRFSRNRLRAVAILGVAVAVVAGVSVGVTTVLPAAIIGATTSAPETRDVVREVTDTTLSGLVVLLVVTLLVGVVTAVAGFVLERRRRGLQPPPVAWPGV